MIWESRMIRKQIEQRSPHYGWHLQNFQRRKDAFRTPLAPQEEQRSILLEVERCLSIVLREQRLRLTPV